MKAPLCAPALECDSRRSAVAVAGWTLCHFRCLYVSANFAPLASAATAVVFLAPLRLIYHSLSCAPAPQLSPPLRLGFRV